MQTGLQAGKSGFFHIDTKFHYQGIHGYTPMIALRSNGNTGGIDSLFSLAQKEPREGDVSREAMMPRMSRYGFALLILSASSCPAWGHGQSAEHEPMQHSEHGSHAATAEIPYVSSAEQYQLPDINLVDVEGRSVSLTSVLESDIPVMLNLIFTTCTAVCPVMSATFEQVRHELGPQRERLHMVSISIDPEHDTPERLREYAMKYHADPMWAFYTGDRTEIVKLQRALEAYRGNKMNHIPLTYLRASSGSPWIRIEGFASAEDLLNEYRRALETRH